MQNTIFEPADLPQIANPPLFDRLIFESGTTTALIILAAALVMAVVLLKAAKSKPALLVFVAGILGATGVFTASTLVVTQREHITDRLKQLVAAVDNADTQSLEELLHESVQVRTRFGGATTRAGVVRLVTTRAAPAVSQIRTSEIKVGLSGQRLARSMIKIKAQSEGPLGTSIWQIDWSRPTEETNQWVATHIEPLWIQGVSNPAGP